MPPEGLKVILPLLLPLQSGLVKTAVVVMAVLVVSVTEFVPVHPLAPVLSPLMWPWVQV